MPTSHTRRSLWLSQLILDASCFLLIIKMSLEFDCSSLGMDAIDWTWFKKGTQLSKFSPRKHKALKPPRYVKLEEYKHLLKQYSQHSRLCCEKVETGKHHDSNDEGDQEHNVNPNQSAEVWRYGKICQREAHPCSSPSDRTVWHSDQMEANLEWKGREHLPKDCKATSERTLQYILPCAFRPHLFHRYTHQTLF